MGISMGGLPRVPVFVSATAPSAPIAGDLWSDTSTATPITKVYDGAAWSAVATSEIVQLYQDTITSGTSWDKTGLSTTDYRYYVILPELSADAGTTDYTLRVNNISTNSYYTWFIDGAGKAITQTAAQSSYAVSVGSQGIQGNIWIPVTRSTANNATCPVFAVSDINMGAADVGIMGYTGAAGASVSRITLSFGASTGKITLLGVK